MSFTKRGLRLVKALESYPVNKPIYFDTMNIFNKIKFTEANEEHLKATMVVDPSMCNGYDIMHGGFIASVVDVMCLYARVGKTNGTLGLTYNVYVNFLSSAHVGDKVMAEVKALESGNNSILETCFYKENGKLIAKGTACFRNATEKQQMECINKIGFDILKCDD